MGNLDPPERYQKQHGHRPDRRGNPNRRLPNLRRYSDWTGPNRVLQQKDSRRLVVGATLVVALSRHGGHLQGVPLHSNTIPDVVL